MPATSLFLRHTLPPTNTLKAIFNSYFKKYRSSLPLSQSHTSHGTRGYQNRKDGIDGPYRNLRDGGPAVSGKEEYDLGLYSTQTVKTNVTAEHCKHFDDDGIRLRVDLEQG